MNKIIFFDGHCTYCNRWVRRAFNANKKRDIFYGPQEHPTSLEILKQHKHNVTENSTVLFLCEKRVYTHSTAALHICKHLDGLWKLAYVFIIVPRPIRDYFYNIIARNRYKWYGREDTCPIPGPELKAQFVI